MVVWGEGFESGRVTRPRYSGWDDVGHEEGLEGVEVAGFEEEALEIRVEIAFEGFVFGCEDCDVVVHNGVF